MNSVVLPTSFAQERLWFLAQLQPGSAVYNMTSPLRLSGRLAVEALEAALRELVRRQEVLRTTFRAIDGRPVQVVHESVTLDLVCEDLSTLAVEARDATVDRVVRDESNRPFDIERGPLFRARLLRLSPDEHVLVLVAHHIVSDGWSLGVMVRETSALYSAFATGAPAPLPEPPIQYADYAQWQREWLQGNELERQLAYWRERLRDLPEALGLHTDFPRPAASSGRGGQVIVELPPDTCAVLRTLCRDEQVTPFVVLMAAFQALIARYTGSVDIVVGTPVANRSRPELEGLIGFFVNTLIVRGDLSGDPDIRTLVGRIGSTVLAAFEHQDVPFERVVEAVAPQRDLSRSPLFQVMLVLQNAPMPELAARGLRVSVQPHETETAKFDLTLSISPLSTGGLTLMFEYSTDLFERASIERMAAHYRVLLEDAVARPDARLSELAATTREERRRLLIDWNDTRVTTPRTLVHEAFVHQARSTPAAPALMFEDDTLSYAALAALSGRLARRLRAHGVGPDVVVGLCADRSFDLLVALLAILRAGGAVLPLDPAYPSARLRFMADDARTPLILCHAHHADLVACGAARTLHLEPLLTACRNADDAPADEDTGVVVDEQHLAYVIYTSGSTGTPKGTAMPHSALRNLCWWQLTASGCNAARTLQFAPLSFDASFQEVLTTLAAGGTLVLVREEQRRDPEALYELLHRARVERWFCPFVALQGVAEIAAQPGRPRLALREILTAGERLEIVPVLARFFHTHSECTLHNLYGPSETHVVTAHTLCGSPRDWDTLPPIGRPIANTRLYVVDRQGVPAPMGVPGELLIGGDAVSRGYLGRPDLTAERFVPDPWSNEAGARLYRSGDLVKYRPDGSIAFLGRIDAQVKIRGFRVEPAEVEAVLQTHPSITRAVVIAQEDGSGQRQLVAYVVPERDTSCDGAMLGAYLRERLPDYLVPGAFVPLAEIPLTPSGKVDRRALPTPSDQQWRIQSNTARGPIEEAVEEIFAEVLGHGRLGIHDNFFELGGHSLAAARVVARVRDVFGLDLPVKALFEGPTVGDVAARIEQARPEAERISRPPLAPRAPNELPLVSFAQERLWFLDQMGTAGEAYHVEHLLRLDGPLDVDALERSVTSVIARHEALRTTFETVDGRPVQIVCEPQPFRFAHVDLSTVIEAARDAALREHVAADTRCPFDLARGPLVRGSLARLAPTLHVGVFTLHHIVTDGWSMGVLIREIGDAYAAHLAGRAPAWEPLPVQYPDYAVWQRRWLQGNVLDAHLRYWRDRLVDAPARVRLATDRPRPPVRSHRGAAVPFQVPSDVAQALHASGLAEGTTLFMTLLAAFKVLLARYTGQTDLVVGTSIANRTTKETERLIGFFTNTLVLRTRWTGEVTFQQVLAAVKESCLGAYAHQEMPFERLVEALAPERDLSRTPLFQIMFVLQNTPTTALSLGELRIEPWPLPAETAKFDLTLTCAETGDGLRGFFEYSTDLFDAATIERLSTNFLTLLAGLVARPDAPISSLPLLADRERRRLLVDWNTRGPERPPDACIHHIVAAQAARTPEAIAVVAGSQTLTYGALEARANQLARYLRARGVGPETIVGVCVDRAPDLGVALLGILKAGGAYLPLDPGHPTPRLAYMLRDARASLVVAQASTRTVLTDVGVTCIDLEMDAALLARYPTTPPASDVAPTNLAYVIYTSGSTGSPKGVTVTHANVVRLFRVTEEWAAFSSADVWTMCHSVAFDFSVWELWGALMYGGRVVMVSAIEMRSPERLYDLLEAHGVTMLSQTPAAFRGLVEMDERRGRPLRVRAVVFGGDMLAPSMLRPWSHRHPETRLVNMYGITEITVHGTVRVLTPADLAGTASPIGVRLPDLQMYVLDRAMQPVPIGVPGELCIAGAGLARGYLNNPDLTAERFVPNPFDDAGGRLYRSGDLVRYRADGELEFLGRIDAQVKVRGFRVEPAEIEAVLEAHAEIRRAVVVAHGEDVRERRLVAYVVLDEGTRLDAGALAAHLRGRLPEHLVPSAFVMVPDLPLTPNGKVDRKALPAPCETAASALTEPPRGPLEATVADLFAEVLNHRRVGIHDSFFEHGGHSLAAVQVMARVRAVFGVEIPVPALFESPSVAELAARIAEARLARADASDKDANDAHEAPSVPLRPSSERGPQPLSFGQERLWFIERMNPGSGAYHISYAVRLSGQLDVSALQAALTALVSRHEVLRTGVIDEGGTPLASVNPPADMRLPVDDLRALEDSTRDEALPQRLAGEAAREYDLASGHVLRARLWRCGESEWIAFLGLHHLVADGWSLDILIRELRACYDAQVHGRAPALAPLPIQYGDYARWQRAWLRGPVMDTLLAYWRRALAGAPLVLDLRPDLRRPPQQSFEGALEPVSLSSELTQRIRALARQEGATTFMTLVAAFQLLLARYADVNDVLVGTPVANRTQVETEGLIGFFVNTLVLRGELHGDPTFAELLARVKSRTLGAFEHQELPFEQLVDALDVPRDPSRSAVCQVHFVWQGTPLPPLTLHGLDTDPLPLERRTAKVDLLMSLADTGGIIEGGVEYATSLYPAAMMRRFVEHYVALLEAVTRHPALPLSTIELWGQAERRRVLEEWGVGPRDTGAMGSGGVETWIAAQCERTPETLAVRSGELRVTYAGLEQQANRLAHRLRACGVGPDVRVGLCLPRSIEQVVAVLAVLKSGGAYVPIDPAYPTARQTYVLSDSAVRVLVTASGLSVPVSADVEVIDLSLDMEALAAQPSTTPPPLALFDHLAYVLYTSGSTGQPKGVMIPRRALANYVRWAAARYVRPTEGVDQAGAMGAPLHSPLTFDLTVTSLLVPLVSGQGVDVAPDGIRDVEALQTLVAARSYSLIKLTPAHLRLLVTQRDGVGTSPIARTMVVGGEALRAHDVAAWRDLAPETVLINEYGPTETTVGCTVAFLDTADASDPVPIGRPIGNTRVQVLDRHGTPVPVGVAGELYIGGAGLARGYLGRPDLTAERFVPDGLSAEPGARLYRSGDRVRWRADGQLEYLGRVDRQLKVRGHRVEPEELEVVLGEYPDVAQAVVVGHPDPAGEVRLTAYVVPRTGGRVDCAALLAAVGERVPAALVPSAILSLPALPLTANGKIDRGALPPPEDAERNASLIGPRDDLELELQAIWQEVLGTQALDVRDNFFERGGHSIAAVRVTAEIRRRLKRTLPIAAVSAHPTLEELAGRIRKTSPTGPKRSLISLRKGAGSPPLFLVHPALGNIACYAPLADALEVDIPLLAFQAPGLDDGRDRRGTVEDYARHYLTELTEHHPEGPYRIAGWSFGGLVAYEMARQLVEAGKTVIALVLIDVSAPCARRSGPELSLECRLDGFAASIGLDVDAPAQTSGQEDLSYIESLLEVGRRAGRIPPAVNLEWARTWFEMYRANLLAAERYVPSAYSGTALLIRAATTADDHRHDLGWGDHVRGGVEVRTIHGTHHSIVRDPDVHALARELRDVVAHV